MDYVRELKNLIKKNPLALYVIEKRKSAKYSQFAEKYGDREFLGMLYMQRIGREMDIDNPKTYTEKLQWLKLYYRDPDIPLASDKYEAKNYIERRGYGDLLIPTLAVYDSVNEIDLDKLPDEFIIKATHGSGWNFICRNKEKFGLSHKKKIMNTWLHSNLYNLGREWNYREQTPRLIVEPLMDDKPLVDYKFHCFNGKCRVVTANHTIGKTEYRDYYDGDWNLYADLNAGTAENSGIPMPKPDNFDEMKRIAEELSKPFPFVRVDLYNVKGRIYFGEMTFFPGSGFFHFTPDKYDYMFGEWINLPERNV